MTQELTDLLKSARELVASRADHHLPLPMRKRIWLSFGPIQLDGKKAVKNSAYEKRVALAVSCCKKVLPIWSECFSDVDIAPKALQLAEKYLENGDGYDTVRAEAYSMIGGLHNVEGMSDEELNAVLVGYACVDAAYTALRDCYCGDPDSLDEDLDTWDASMQAAGAYSGGFPWQDPPFCSDPEKLLEFWSWYLDEVDKLG